ncbi:AAA family ATPase [Aquabacterium sp.]|uniref:AAA family ATPase n=1 Tax=Aquabacterium sp. TaxID=1872578 RepID=UPI003CFF3FC9
MKIDKINIDNFLGARVIDVSTAAPVQLFCGPNGAGKSSIRDAVALALTADLGRVSLKKEAGQLVSEGAKAARCEVITSDGDVYTVGISNAGKITDGASGKASDPVWPYVLDAQRFGQLSANERRTFLMGLMDVKTDPATVKEMLAARSLDAAKIDRIAPLLRAGFDSAHKEAKAKATEARGAWKAITGEAFGSEKAKTWRAEVPKYDAGKLKELQTELQHADVAIASWQQQVGALTAEQRRRDELRAKLPALQEHAGRFDRIMKKLTADEQQLADWQADLEKTLAAAGQASPRVGLVHELGWSLAFLVFYGDALDLENENDRRVRAALDAYEAEHGKVSFANDQPVADGKAAARLPSIRASVELCTKAVANDQRDREAARQAGLEVEAIEQELAKPVDEQALAGARKQIASLQAKRAEVHKALDTIQSLKLQAEAADKRTKEAAVHADDVAAWDELGAALAPDGIPAEILAKTLGPINERLAQSAADAAWLKAEINADMVLTGGGRDYRLLSESEQWRVDAMVAEAIAHLSGARLLVLDRFDVLDPASRSDLIGWLDVLADMGEIDTALVFGTLKSLPAGLPPTVAAHWITGGSLVPQLKAAA